MMFFIWVTLRNKILENEISRQIKEYRKDGKRVVIIDDWALLANKKLVNKMEHIYVLSRKFLSRRNSVRNRDDASIIDQKINDLPYALGFMDSNAYLNTSIITNFGTLEELYQKADQEYKEIGELSFDERYFVKNKLTVIASAASTAKKGGKSSMKDISDAQTR